MLKKVRDFVIPSLAILQSLGGEANLREIEDAFYRRFAPVLDPSIDWTKITPNHNKPLWADYCGSRVVYRFLNPEGYIVIESHGSKGFHLEAHREGNCKTQSKQIKPIITD